MRRRPASQQRCSRQQLSPGPSIRLPSTSRTGTLPSTGGPSAAFARSVAASAVSQGPHWANRFIKATSETSVTPRAAASAAVRRSDRPPGP